MIQNCSWIGITDSAILLIGSNAQTADAWDVELSIIGCQFYAAAGYTVADPFVNVNQGGGSTPETTTYGIIQGCKFNAEAVSGQVTFINVIEGNYFIELNDFVAFPSSSTVNPIYISATVGGVGGLFIRRNSMRGRTQAFGTAGGGYCIYLSATAAGLNEVFIEDNQFNVNTINHVYMAAYPTQGLTVGHTIRIARNYSNRASQDAYRIEPNGGQIGEIQILDNLCVDHNWSNSTSPYYAMIAVNRGSSGSVFGCLISGNYGGTTDAQVSFSGTAVQYGVWVAGNVYSLNITDNTFDHEAQTGVAPIAGVGGYFLNNSIFGQVLSQSENGNPTVTPATGVKTFNQFGWKALLIISGAAITNVTVDGATVAASGTTPVLIELGALDWFSIAYTGTITIEYILH